MAEKESLEESIHCYFELEKNRKIFVAHDKNGNYATSPISHKEAAEYLKKRSSF